MIGIAVEAAVSSYHSISAVEPQFPFVQIAGDTLSSAATQAIHPMPSWGATRESLTPE
jgi:hypothetical protein